MCGLELFDPQGFGLARSPVACKSRMVHHVGTHVMPSVQMLKFVVLSCAVALRQISEDSLLQVQLSQEEIFTPEQLEKMIADYRADWEKHGVKVEVYENVSDLEAKAPLPWKTPLDKSVDFNIVPEDRPRCQEAGKCQEVTLEDVVPHLKKNPYLYHGSDVKVDSFAAGIDFSKGKDQITGPAFFTTHNIFYALLYGGMVRSTWAITDDAQYTHYSQVLEIAIEHLEQCKGLVADTAFMEKAAEVGSAKVAEWMETQCGGHKCSFIAVNWNEDGKLGSGKLPYEFRMLPGSETTCGLKFDKVIMVKSSQGKEMEVLMNPDMQATATLYQKLQKISMEDKSNIGNGA